MLGCIKEKAVAPAVRAAESTIGSIAVSPVNAIMAVGDTLQISVSGQTLAGVPLTSFDSVKYILQNITDTLRVRVSPTGLVIALATNATAAPAQLFAFAFKDDIVKDESILIRITPTSVPGATLSIQPVPPDSAKLAYLSVKTITPVIRNPATGQSVASPMLRYTYRAADAARMGCVRLADNTLITTATALNVSNNQLRLSDCPSITGLGLNQISPLVQSGTAWVYATATVYGVPLQDSVQYTLTHAYTGIANVAFIGENFVSRGENTIYLAPGGTVTFTESPFPAVVATVTFTLDNPAAATAATPPASAGGTSGNVTPMTNGQSSTRRFLTSGTYTWTATVGGTIGPPYVGQQVSGKIVVE